MTSASIFFVLLCLLIINQKGLGYVQRDLRHDWGNSLDNDQREVISRRQFSHNTNYLNSGYTKDNFNVYFMGQKIPGASASTFKVLSNGYAKDNWNVYYMGQKLTDVSASTFELLPNDYTKDNWNVYYRGTKNPGASASTFKVLSNGYAKDSWDVYFMGQKVPGASASSFSMSRRKL